MIKGMSTRLRAGLAAAITVIITLTLVIVAHMSASEDSVLVDAGGIAGCSGTGDEATAKLIGDMFDVAPSSTGAPTVEYTAPTRASLLQQAASALGDNGTSGKALRVFPSQTTAHESRSIERA